MSTTSITSYEEAVANHEWHVPERYNIAQDVCDKHPADKLAMIHEHFDGTVREVQWGELQELSNRFANVLRAHGVEKGDRVAMLLPPTPETAAAFFGTWKCGAILLSMSVLYGDDGIRHRVSDSQAKVLVTNAANRDRVDRVAGRARAGARRVGLLEGARRSSSPRTRWPTTRRSSTTRAARPGWPRGSSTRTGTCSRTRSSSTATTCRTASASTGWASGRGRRGSRRCSGRGASARSSSSTSARAGSTRTSSSTFLSRHEASNVFTTPTAMRSMMSIGDAGTRYPQKFRIVCSAGEPLNPEAISWFREQYGLTVLDYYGLTESYPLCANYPFMDVREGSMGKPMPGWDVQILDENEQPLPRGEKGEICLRARSNPHYPLGYWRNEEAAQRDVRRRLVPHQGRRALRRGRLRLVRGPGGRRDHLRGLPDRAVRGRVGVPGARGGQGGGGDRGARRAARLDREGVRGAGRGP